MTPAMKTMLDVAPERHVHIKGNTIYTTRHPAGTADSLRRDYMVTRKALEIMRAEAEQGWQAHDLTYHAMSVNEALTEARKSVLL